MSEELESQTTPLEDHGHEHEHRHTTPLGYVLVLISLLILTTITVAAFKTIHNPTLNIAIALLIAFTKASLVLYFFMHLRESPAIVKVTGITGFIFVGVMIMFFLTDIRARPMEDGTPDKWPATSVQPADASLVRPPG